MRTSLAKLILEETGAKPEQVMLMRHSGNHTRKLVEFGADQLDALVYEHTATQKIGGKYDFWRDGSPPISYVAAVIQDTNSGRDVVHSVYQVIGVEAEGIGPTIYSQPFNLLNNYRETSGESERQFQDEPTRKYNLKVFKGTRTKGAMVTGWEGRGLSTPLRSNGRLFWEINVDVPDTQLIFAEDDGHSDEELESAFQDNRLRFGNIETSNQRGETNQRRGQGAVRKGSLRTYGIRCALCDVNDERLLRASHIQGWAECEAARGNPANVICLCAFHDALFENGYWSLDDQLKVVVKSDIQSETIRRLIHDKCSFRSPSHYPPAIEFVSHHRAKHGFTAP